MKKITLSILAAFAALFSINANAQHAGVYCLDYLDGVSTNSALTANSTNHYAANFVNQFSGMEGVGSPIMDCVQFTNVGWTVTATGLDPSAMGNLTLRFARSDDGGNIFETVPSYSITLALNGTNRVVALGLMYVPGETHVEIVSGENPTAYDAKVSVFYNLKIPKWGAWQTAR